MTNLGDLGTVFLLGLTGAGHCIGMCGVFSIAVSAGAGRVGTVIWRQVVYQLGKALSYAFVGLILLLAVGWAEARWPLLRVQSTLSIAVGVLMVLLGAAYALEVRLPAAFSRWLQGSATCGALQTLWRSPSPWRSLLIGWVNGLLPCGLSLTALLALVGRGSAGGVVTGAFVFSLATLPGLLAVGLLGLKLSALHRRWLVRIGGVLLVLLGVWTVVRGVPVWNAWLHGRAVSDGAGCCH